MAPLAVLLSRLSSRLVNALIVHSVIAFSDKYRHTGRTFTELENIAQKNPEFKFVLKVSEFDFCEKSRNFIMINLIVFGFKL